MPGVKNPREEYTSPGASLGGPAGGSRGHSDPPAPGHHSHTPRRQPTPALCPKLLVPNLVPTGAIWRVSAPVDARTGATWGAPCLRTRTPQNPEDTRDSAASSGESGIRTRGRGQNPYADLA